MLRNLVVPELGDYTPRTSSRRSRSTTLLADLGQQSVNRQRKAKVILGAMLDVAVADGALTDNPVRGSLSISRPPASQPRSPAAEIAQVHAAVRAWLGKDRPGPKSSGDMVDIIELMIATGARIGEVLALRWRDIDLDAGTIEINATIKTESGRGTYRKVARSTPHRRAAGLHNAAPWPASAAPCRPNQLDAVFPTRNATWQQVNNVERRWRQIRREAGLEWITPERLPPVTEGIRARAAAQSRRRRDAATPRRRHRVRGRRARAVRPPRLRPPAPEAHHRAVTGRSVRSRCAAGVRSTVRSRSM